MSGRPTLIRQREAKQIIAAAKKMGRSKLSFASATFRWSCT